MIELIYDALDARMTLFGGAIQFVGRIASPKLDRAYVATSMPAFGSQMFGVGPFVPRQWSGLYQGLVCHPRHEGRSVALATADALLAHFPRSMTLVNGAAKVIIESATTRPLYATADWNNVPVIVSWFCTEMPA